MSMELPLTVTVLKNASSEPLDRTAFCMYKSAKRSVIFIDISESLSSLKGRDYKRAVRIFWCRLRYNHTYRQRNMVRRKTIRA